MVFMDQNFRPINNNDLAMAEILGIDASEDSTILFARLGKLTDTVTLLFHGADFVFDKGMELDRELNKFENKQPVTKVLTELQVTWREGHPSVNNPTSGERSKFFFLGREIRCALVGEQVKQEFADLIDDALNRLAPEFGIENITHKYNIGNTPMSEIVAGLSSLNR